MNGYARIGQVEEVGLRRLQGQCVNRITHNQEVDSSGMCGERSRTAWVGSQTDNVRTVASRGRTAREMDDVKNIFVKLESQS